MTEEKISYYRKRGFHWNADKNIFEVYVFDKVVKELSEFVVIDFNERNQLPKIMASVKAEAVQELTKKLIDL